MKYKLLLISDTEVLYKYPIKTLKQKFKDIDLIISAGDLSNKYLDYVFTIIGKDLIYVDGNHTYSKDHKIPFCHKINGKTFKKKGIKFLGLDGSMLYSGGKHQYTESEMMWKILKNSPHILFNKPDVILTHAPIKGIHDVDDVVHEGFKSFQWLLDHISPKLWIHGHIHLRSHMKKQETIVNGTRIVNAYGYKIINVEI
ncbi:MAG: metallophosphoesterase family protein [Fusobacteriota bacterium]